MKTKGRTKKAMINIVVGIASEVVSLVCGLILPRLILSNFGSAYNGITQSITQFISVIALMKAGIGGATRAALYKPLAEGDTREISEVLASTQKFMRKIAMVFVIFVLCFACIYPIFICRDFDWLFSASLIIIISISTFAQYYFGFTYQMLLMADQRMYIHTIIEIVTTIVYTIVSVILINAGCTIHIVKLGSAVVNLLSPMFLYFYVRKKYKLIDIKNPSSDKIPQKWDATAHEVASFINNNTDVMVLTMFTNLLEVSVYTIYHYVITNIKKIVSVFITGFGAAFGDMYVKNEFEEMKINLGIYELIMYSFATVLYSTTLVMIIPFVMNYTEGVIDVNYNRPLFAIIITLAGAFDCFRIPYKSIVLDCGHYKQTRNGAILEAVINIVISLLAVSRYGIVGVSIGTLAALSFRTIQYAIYMSKNIIKRKYSYFISHIVISLLVIFIVKELSKMYLPIINNWGLWIIYAFITTIISIAITAVSDYLFYREDMFNLIRKLKSNFKKKKA